MSLRKIINRIYDLLGFPFIKRKIILRSSVEITLLFYMLILIISIIFFNGLKFLILKENRILVRHEVLEIQEKIEVMNGNLSKDSNFGIIDDNFYFRIYKNNQLIFVSDNNFEKIKIENYIISKTKDLYVKNDFFGKIEIFKVLEEEEEFIEGMFLLTVFINILSFIILVLIIKKFHKNLTKPFKNIEKTMNELKIGNLILLENKGNNDEFDKLADTFNQMIERVENSYNVQSRFVSDASHELRTPLSIIKGNIDMLNKWGKNDKTILDEAILTIKQEVDEMTSLIEKLLFIAKGENTQKILKIEDFDIDKLFDEIIEEYTLTNSDVIFNKKSKNLIIKGDKLLVKQMLRALIDNGIKYSIEKEITLGLFEEDRAIYIKDKGFGIAEENLNKIFDRFYRVDSHRNKNLGGTGLGLSIVKLIADLNNYKIQVKSELGKGTTFIISV